MKKILASVGIIAALGLSACDSSHGTSTSFVSHSATVSASATPTSNTVDHTFGNWHMTTPKGLVKATDPDDDSTTYHWRDKAHHKDITFNMMSTDDPNNDGPSILSYPAMIIMVENEFKSHGVLYSSIDIDGKIKGANMAHMVTGYSNENNSYLSIVIANEGNDMAMLSASSPVKSDLNSPFGMSVMTLTHN